MATAGKKECSCSGNRGQCDYFWYLREEASKNRQTICRLTFGRELTMEELDSIYNFIDENISTDYISFVKDFEIKGE